jgi:trehalose-6-phosphate synthase
MKEDEKNMKFSKDLAYVTHNTTFTWIKNFFIDLKRNSMVLILLT